MKDGDFLSWWNDRGVLVGDGAMGTALQAAGLPEGACPESWNLDRPEMVESITASYLEAGADILMTNSFGANPRRLAVFGLAARCAEINRAAAGIARKVAGNHARVFGSIGPTGETLDQDGTLSEEEAFDGFRLQAEALAAGGVDGLLVETMTDLGEAVTAVRAAGGTGLPVVATMTFGPPDGEQFPNTCREIDRAARELQEAGACGLGANCGTGPEPLVETVRILRSATRLPIVVQPSCGVPRQEAGKLLFPVDPEDMARFIADFVQAGATWIGGCCGTTETHIRAMAREVERVQLLP